MTQKYSRAQRRADYARLKKKRRDHWGYGKQGWRSYCEHKRGSLHEMPEDVAGMVVDTPTPCSCYVCGNPRRNDWAHGMSKYTIQELRADDAYADGIDELWIDWGWEDDPYWDMYDDDWDFSQKDPADDWYLRWMYIKG